MKKRQSKINRWLRKKVLRWLGLEKVYRIAVMAKLDIAILELQVESLQIEIEELKVKA